MQHDHRTLMNLLSHRIIPLLGQNLKDERTLTHDIAFRLTKIPDEMLDY